MPFLILPSSFPRTEQHLEALGARLCPYRDSLTRTELPGGMELWSTSLVVVEGQSARARLGGGTADFHLQWDHESITVRTDALGACPIWFGHSPQGWLVSPETKALGALIPVSFLEENALRNQAWRPPGWSPFEEVLRLPQGKEMQLSAHDLTVRGDCVSFTSERAPLQPNEDWPARLGAQLLQSFRPPPAATGAFISGGIDSSLACAFARTHGPVHAYSLGTSFGNEFDHARDLATALDCPFEEVGLTEGQVRAEIEQVVFANEVFDGLTAEILIQLSTLCRAAADRCTHVVTGYGADLLLDGMLRHAPYMALTGASTTEELLARTRWTGELSPFYHWAQGVAMDHVFLAPDLIRMAIGIPAELCLVDGVEKFVLREAAVGCGLLDRTLAFRPKKGLSDGTQAHRLLTEALELDGVGLESYHQKSTLCHHLLQQAIRLP